LALFQTLSPYLARPVPDGFYSQQSQSLAMTEGSLRVAMHRLIRRFGEMLRSEVAGTVSNPSLVEDELRAVIEAWARA
jgi:RNA polymerase sigma-70 factor (ECF subfamily)